MTWLISGDFGRLAALGSLATSAVRRPGWSRATWVVSRDLGGLPQRGWSDDLGGLALLYNFCLFVDGRLPAAQHVAVCHFIEQTVLRLARHGRFSAVLTNNTNPVTQVPIALSQ